MEEQLEEQEPQKNPEGDPMPQDGGEEAPNATSLSPEEIAELKRKADASSQNFERAKKAEAEAKQAKIEAEKLRKAQSSSLDVEDYIDISASLHGLDQREQSRLAEEHKLSGKPLKEIRNSEDFLLWQSAYRQKVEKERALKPSGTQADSEQKKSFAQRLAEADMEGKEKLLREAGLYKEPRPRADRVNIGQR